MVERGREHRETPSEADCGSRLNSKCEEQVKEGGVRRERERAQAERVTISG